MFSDLSVAFMDTSTLYFEGRGGATFGKRGPSRPVGYDTDTPDAEAAARTVDDNRDQRGDGRVAGPHLAESQPFVLIHDDADHHLLRSRAQQILESALLQRRDGRLH